MKKVFYRIAHVILTGLDLVAPFFLLPWQYKDRKMKERIRGKK